MSRQLKMAGIITLVLMWVFTSVVNAASPPLQEEGREYVVQADDWLSKLAEKYLGDATSWNLIVEATNTKAAIEPHLTVIENPNLIYPGQIIFIPLVSSISPPEVQPVGEVVSLGNLCEDQHPSVQAFCSEIPIARVHFDPHEAAEFFTCASRAGLGNVPVDPNEVTILIPNDGDFDLRGIAAAVKIAQGGLFLIPRWPGSRFDFSAEFAEEYGLPVGEQLEIPLTKAFELIKAGELIWTGQHGVPGKAGLFQSNPPLTCDPEADFEIELGPFNPTS